MRRRSKMLNLPRSPAHNPKFHTQLLNSPGSSQTLPLLLLFLRKYLWFGLWDVCLTETDMLFKMFPTMIPCKVGTMHSKNKISRGS